MPMPGRTIAEGSHQDQDQAQRLMTAAKARATAAATDITDWLACSVRAQVKGPRPVVDLLRGSTWSA